MITAYEKEGHEQRKCRAEHAEQMRAAGQSRAEANRSGRAGQSRAEANKAAGQGRAGLSPGK